MSSQCLNRERNERMTGKIISAFRENLCDYPWHNSSSTTVSRIGKVDSKKQGRTVIKISICEKLGIAAASSTEYHNLRCAGKNALPAQKKADCCRMRKSQRYPTCTKERHLQDNLSCAYQCWFIQQWPFIPNQEDVPKWLLFLLQTFLFAQYWKQQFIRIKTHYHTKATELYRDLKEFRLGLFQQHLSPNREIAGLQKHPNAVPSLYQLEEQQHISEGRWQKRERKKKDDSESKKKKMISLLFHQCVDMRKTIKKKG